MQKITIRTLKHQAKMLDARAVQRTSIGFFESSARGEAAYDGVKAAQRAHDEAKAAENVANLRATQQFQILAMYIDKLDSTMQRERQHYKQSIRSCRDNNIKRLEITNPPRPPQNKHTRGALIRICLGWFGLVR